jgi:HlyD family secretion protein
MGMNTNQLKSFRWPVMVLAVVSAVVAAMWISPFDSTGDSASGVSGMEDQRTTIQEKPAAGRSGVYVVENGQIVRVHILTGELQAARSIVINAPRIQSSFQSTITYLAPEGTVVRRGERIVEFDDSNLLSQRSEAERTLDETLLNIEKRKVDLEAERCDLLNALAQAEASHERDMLYSKISKDLLPANTYQRYQLNLERSKLSLQKAREQLENFQNTYESQMALVEINRSQAEVNLKKIDSDMQLLRINAPQDGIVIYGDNWTSNRKIQPGDSIFPGMEVANLPDLTSLQVVGYVFDTEYSAITPNMRCIIKLDALPDFQVGGTVLSLTNVAGRKNFASEKKVFQATIRMDEVDPSLVKPGMTARVDIPLVLAQKTPVIPRDYLGIDDQGRAYVLKGSDPRRSQVEYVSLGAIGDLMVEAVSGVTTGDRLLPIAYMAEVRK